MQCEKCMLSSNKMKMKSFHVYLREPTFNPARIASEYTAEEIEIYRNKFKPLAERYRNGQRKISVLIAVFVVTILIGVFIPPSVAPYFLPIVVGAILSGIVLQIIYRLPKCPCCSGSLGHNGSFCPQCGSKFQKHSILGTPYCDSCCKYLRQGKGGRNYNIQTCTHCGLKFEDVLD
jgi:hypothetical protein